MDIKEKSYGIFWGDDTMVCSRKLVFPSIKDALNYMKNNALYEQVGDTLQFTHNITWDVFSIKEIV